MTGLIILVLFCYFFLDLRIALFVHQTLNNEKELFGNIFSYFGNRMIVVPFLIYFLISFFDRKKYGFFLSKKVLITFIIANITTTLLKIIVGRARPYLYFKHGIYGCYYFNLKHDFWSFPSGHVTTATAIFFSLSLLTESKFLCYLFYLIIMLVAIARIFLDYHYLSDTIMGAIIGIISAYICYNDNDPNNKRYESIINKRYHCS